MNRTAYEKGKLDQSLAHGRFQPLHSQHLEYLLAAKKRCLFLWIGITRYDINELVFSPIAPHREKRLANPLTFFERIEVITAVFKSLGIKRGEFGFVPLPIENPDRITNFIRSDIQVFTTICDEWNLHKIKVFKELGFKVESLIDRRNQPKDEIITGKYIRESALAGDDNGRIYTLRGFRCLRKTSIC